MAIQIFPQIDPKAADSLLLIISDSERGFKLSKCLLSYYNAVYLTPSQTYALIIFRRPTH